MKKYFNDIRILAAMLIASAAFVACSSEDDGQETTPQQPAGKYTMTVEVNKASDEASTRALTLTGGELTPTWKEGEVVKVVKDNTVIGELTAQASSTGSTTLTGQIDEANLPSNGETLTFYLHDTLFDYTGQNGLLTNGNEKSIENNYDYDYCTAAVSVDSEKKTISVPNRISFESPEQAIIKFTLLDKATGNPINADKLTISGSHGPSKWVKKVNMLSLADEGDIDVTPESATNVIYVSLYQPNAYSLTLTATAGALTYEYDYKGGGDKPGTLSMVHGRYYDVTVKMTRKGINLSKLTPNTECRVLDGDVLSGTLDKKVKILIADGARVKLAHGTTINGINDMDHCVWAGITCEGDATLVVDGEVSIRGFHENYPGIYVPEGKTLTITGGGTLNASSNGYGAGIGGGWCLSCGNIEIISGPLNVYATGGQQAAAIGSGREARCGSITIHTVFKVEATKGSNAPYCIGMGNLGSCGTITMGNTVYYDGSAFTSDDLQEALMAETFTWQP